MRKYWKKGKVTIIAALWHKVITIPESKLLAWTEQLISFIFMSNYSYQLSHELFEDSSYSRERERERGGVEFCLYSESWMRVTETKAFTTETDLSTKKKRIDQADLKSCRCMQWKLWKYILFYLMNWHFLNCIIALQLAVEYSSFYTALAILDSDDCMILMTDISV